MDVRVVSVSTALVASVRTTSAQVVLEYGSAVTGFAPDTLSFDGAALIRRSWAAYHVDGDSRVFPIVERYERLP